jgi:hypothetical protein
MYVSCSSDRYIPPKFFTFQRIKSLYQEHLTHTLFIRSVPECISNDYLYYLLASIGEIAVFNTSFRSQWSFVVCTYYDLRCALIAYSFLILPGTMMNIKCHLLKHPELISRHLVADRMKNVKVNTNGKLQTEFDYKNNEIYLFYLIAQCGDSFLIGLPLIRSPFLMLLLNPFQVNPFPNTGSVVIFNLANDMNDEFIKNNLNTYGEVMEVRKSLKKICESSLGKSEDDGHNNTSPRFIEFYDLRSAELCAKRGLVAIGKMDYKVQLLIIQI